MKAVLIGVGQAGGKIAQAIVEYDHEAGFHAISDAIAVNTARSDLESLSLDTTLVGEDRVKGHGVGGDNELGATVMQDDIGEVTEALDGRIATEAEALFVVAGLGGGTGSGGAPVIARRLREVYDLPVYGLGILPGRDEGAMYQVNAGRSFKTFVRETDSLLLIDNDAWRSGGESIKEAHAAINEAIAQRVGVLLASGESVDAVGESVVDSSEVINTLAEGSVSALGYASAVASDESAENVNTVTSLVRKALLSGMSLPGAVEAGAALVVVAGRPEAIPRKGVERARSWVEEETGSLHVRGGDFPLESDRLAALVLLSGIERTERVERIVERAERAREQDREREDPAEALVSDELDDLI